MLDPAEFDRKWEADERAGGAENEIYFDDISGRWFKRNNLGYHRSYVEYLKRIELHNQLFPETALRFEG